VKFVQALIEVLSRLGFDYAEVVKRQTMMTQQEFVTEAIWRLYGASKEVE